MPRNSVDEPLLPDDIFEKLVLEGKLAERAPFWRRNAVLAVSMMLNIILLLGYAFPFQVATPPARYSPANEVLETVPTLFHDVWDPSIYNGPPSPELDEAWDALFLNGILQLPKSQAALLPNKTTPIPGNEENYIVTLDVFHQLHCLNMVRQAFHQDYYTEDFYKQKGVGHPLHTVIQGHEDWEHVGHCIDSVRASLMCSADVTPVVWAWDEQRQKNAPRMDVVHNCRNYGKLQEWASRNVLKSPYNPFIRLEDDL
ncbi:hypothetical protein HYDPIDRAFT_110449 [Hydnomerulius pinastri MD-312]|nr:hypothetical protein HYDPIDRAFT_110449 [Hydnomerulius pinastri MD-312]